MLTFQQKRVIARRIARVDQIERYRQMLIAVRHPEARRKMIDKEALAVALVYDLLESYSPEQIQESMPANMPEKNSMGIPAAAPAVKKKFQNLMNTRPSNGGTWKTPASGRPTAYTRTASIFGIVCGNLKALSGAVTSRIAESLKK